MKISTKPLGDNALKVEFHKEVSPELNEIIRLFCQKLTDYPIEGVNEWVPAFDSVGIYYDQHQVSYDELIIKMKNLHAKKVVGKTTPGRLLTIPVYYEGQDLERVAIHAKCKTDEVIKLHQETTYLVYMLGFLPGFPYLGGMSNVIATPRLENPREKIPAGSVGIADNQTGIYPMESPGGWNIIGETPVKLFDNEAENPILFHAGDQVKFHAISKGRFAEIRKQVENNTYEIEWEEVT